MVSRTGRPAESFASLFIAAREQLDHMVATVRKAFGR